MPEQKKPRLYYVDAGKTKVVGEDHPDARFVVNPDDPGEFGDLLKGHGDHSKKAAAEPEATEDAPKAEPPAGEALTSEQFPPEVPREPAPHSTGRAGKRSRGRR